MVTCLVVQAAESQAAELMVQIKARGCKEEFIAKPDLLAEGKVGIRCLPTEKMMQRRSVPAAFC